ncbi:High mobility group B protein 7 [Raphanus sativus]|uniref:High mobility group B protein 7-like n=1 Tax=Raphanus sativus TaxID=3726 RepID=A0A9W3D0V4_RAPSA|nr:high mobility group B protein 7-like [Raphanus sativus]KAJ4866603.1 High mobility group B protein 7 [Raphanus sativus]
MAGGGSKSTAPKARKRVDAETKPETTANNNNTLLRAKDGSAFVRCEGCNKNVAVALISMHNCSLDAKIRVNLEAQVVETQTEAKKKPVERKKSTSDEPKAKRVRKAKDENKKKSSSSSNKPKRPLTAFFIFMADFRKTFKEENPDAGVKDVAKQGGEKWKSLDEEEKKVYLDKAAELKAEYNKSLESSKDADEEEVDEEKEADDADEKQSDEAEEKQTDEAEDNEGENKEAEGKEEEDEILDDY